MIDHVLGGAVKVTLGEPLGTARRPQQAMTGLPC